MDSNIVDTAVLSVDQARERLQIGRTKIYELINSGQLKARKLGKKTFILTQDLEAFIDSLELYPANDTEDQNDIAL